MASKYSVEIRDQFGRLVTVLQRPQKKQFSIYRNRPGSVQFTLDLFDPQATAQNFALNQYDVVFRRLGTPVAYGQISYVHPTIDGDAKQLEIIATGYFDLLDYRYIDNDFPGFDSAHLQLPFAATDTGQIAWTLLSDTQFPLTQDGSQTSSGPGLTLNQSFISPGTANVTTLKLLLKNSSASGNLIVALYADAGGVPSGTLITNSRVSIPVGGVSSTLGWYEIDYAPGAVPPLTAGTTYWIKAFLDTNQSGSNGVYWSYLNNNYYLNGRAYSPESPGLFTSSQDLQFFVLLDDNSYQQTKNTYLGLRQGTINPSFSLAPTYSQYKKIKNCVEDLANTYNGMDFNISVAIDPTTDRMTKYFNVFYPRQGVDNTKLTFTYPGNIKKLDKPKDGKTMVNQVAERGQGSGINQAVVVSVDTASIQAYGVRQDIVDDPDVPDTATLSLLGQEVIRTRKDTLDLPALTLDGNVPPHLGDYGLGDQILIEISQAGAGNVSATYRIEQIDGVVDDDDMEELILTLSLA